MYSILSQILGRKPGIIIAGYKPKGGSFEPHQFNTVNELTQWATPLVGDVFFCPMRRGKKNPRNQWAGLGSNYLWVDIDWAKVPTTEQDRVDRAITKLGAIRIASGSIENWRTNVHVYVRLNETIDVKRHTALNEALRNFLWAGLDGKYADNTLLRVPDTQNYKSDPSRPVHVIGGHGRRVNVDALEARLKVAQRPVETRTRGWRRVDVSRVSGSAKWLTRMDVGEAECRFGSRYKGAWFVIGELLKKKLTDDQIHTLMDQFPPGVDKWDDRQWHNQIDSILNKRRA